MQRESEEKVGPKGMLLGYIYIQQPRCSETHNGSMKCKFGQMNIYAMQHCDKQDRKQLSTNLGGEDRPREPRESLTTAVTRAYGTFPAVLAKFSNNTYVMILSTTHKILVGD